MKTLLTTFICFPMLFGSCGTSMQTEEESVFNADSLKKYAGLALDGDAGWIMLSQPGICWNCNGYYYYLGKEINNEPDAQLVLLTQKFRPAAKKEMYEGLTWKFSDRIFHLENPSLFQNIRRHAGKGNGLIHLNKGEVHVYAIDDRDKMIEQWPMVKKGIADTP